MLARFGNKQHVVGGGGCGFRELDFECSHTFFRIDGPHGVESHSNSAHTRGAAVFAPSQEVHEVLGTNIYI